MKNILLNIVEFIDNLIVKSMDRFYIPNSKRQVLYLVLKTYNREDLLLPNGQIIKRRSPIGEIHIDNQKIKKMNLGYKEILRLLKDELDALSIALREDENLKEVQAFYGKTLFYPLLKREGFIILDLKPSLKVLLTEFWIKVLRLVYSNNNIRKKDRKIKEVWITREDLQKRKML